MGRLADDFLFYASVTFFLLMTAAAITALPALWFMNYQCDKTCPSGTMGKISNSFRCECLDAVIIP